MIKISYLTQICRCETFEVLQPVEGISFSIAQLLGAALDVVGRTAATARAPKLPAPVPAPGLLDGLCSGVRSLFTSAAATAAPLPAPPRSAPLRERHVRPGGH